ncbi:Uncharacterised protein [Yersinia frederiksenii]|uniref:hypothetical protein n=1 Tax=Yersinia alsatica TaxID=2890317 RepID=UPI0005DDFECD|nr:hypothetical protein [Yersinia alsatica]CNC24282.1 Uncharacterised protein [Yersinia frederiksenii]CNH75031.1 Uncharacterised protein [Yersinia frederiksenii]
MPATDSNKMWADLLHDDPAARQEVLAEVRECIRAGEINVAKGMLVTLFKAWQRKSA